MGIDVFLFASRHLIVVCTQTCMFRCCIVLRQLYADCIRCCSDEEISTNVTPTSSPTTHTGPVTRARARQLNYQVLSFLANPSNIQEHMMLPKLDTFVCLMNEGPSMDKKDGHWSGIKHGEGGARAGKDNGASSGDFRTLKPP